MNSLRSFHPLARFAVALALLLPAGQVLAQSPTPEPAAPKAERLRGVGRGAKPAGASEPELRSETFRLVDAYVISNLQESLGLTDEQFAKALPIVKKLQSDRREYAMKRMAALRQLRRTLQSGTATEASVSELLAEVKGAVAAERAASTSNIEALDALLSTLQQAKYRVFEAEVDSRLRHLLARIQDRDRPQSR